MSFKKETYNDKVMSRMEWFRDLKIIYNKLVNEEDILTPIDKTQILKELNTRIPKLDLKDSIEYYSKSKVQAFSLEEIITHISSLEEKNINFDQLIDSLIYLSIEKKRNKKTLPIPELLNCQKPLTQPFKDQNYTRNPNSMIIKQFSKEYNYTALKPQNLMKNTTFDLSFPDQKLINYPDFDSYTNLLYLSLAGNNLFSTHYIFPSTLQVLNLSSNKINEFRLEVELKNLVLLNLTSNQINVMTNMNAIKNIKELYIANNCVTGINMLCHLSELALLDCSHNEIESFEDIAGLVISKRLGILKLRGNPLSSKANYEQVVNSILPRIYCLDPFNIIEHSLFKSLGSLPFLPIKDSFESVEDLTVRNENLASIRSQASITNRTTNAGFSPLGKIQSSKAINLTHTPVGTATKKPVIKRSTSQIRIEKSSVLTNTTKTSMKFDLQDDRKSLKNELNGSIMDMAERRIKIFDGEKKSQSISVVSNESIQSIKKKQYGNPIAAMMIGPPAILSQNRVSKSPICLSLDFSRKRRTK